MAHTLFVECFPLKFTSYLSKQKPQANTCTTDHFSLRRNVSRGPQQQLGLFEAALKGQSQTPWPQENRGDRSSGPSGTWVGTGKLPDSLEGQGRKQVDREFERNWRAGIGARGRGQGRWGGKQESPGSVALAHHRQVCLFAQLYCHASWAQMSRTHCSRPFLHNFRHRGTGHCQAPS